MISLHCNDQDSGQNKAKTVQAGQRRRTERNGIAACHGSVGLNVAH